MQLYKQQGCHPLHICLAAISSATLLVSSSHQNALSQVVACVALCNEKLRQYTPTAKPGGLKKKLSRRDEARLRIDPICHARGSTGKHQTN